MGDAWTLKVWGVRGSFPAPGAEFLNYGGNTCCLSLEWGDTLVVLDGGSGLAALGQYIAREKRRRVDILLSHLHLDHIMGLFPFAPLHAPFTEVHLYGTPGIVRELAHLVGPPLWPVELSDCRAKVCLHEFLFQDSFSLGGAAVTTLKGSHPGGCVYYRLEDGKHSLVYALDCELSGDMAPRLTAFARGADLLVWDASFVPEDFKPGWGHSTWREGLALGRAAGVKRVLMTHYSREYTDEFIQRQEALAREMDGGCLFAREGMVIEL